VKKVGIVYHPHIAAAKILAEQLSQFLPSLKASSWICSSWDVENIEAHIQGTDLVLSVGGDGTILRIARALIPYETPILGGNLGHLGFDTEICADDSTDKLPVVISGSGWIDQRTMLEIEVLYKGGDDSHHKPLYALNDAVVGRGAKLRIVYIKISIDGESLTTYKADGVIVSTATGSTGYSLAAGGPILYPQAEQIIINPVSAHLTTDYAIVLPSTASIELEVHTDHQAVLSIDGQVEFALQDGDKIKVKRSPYSAHFIRIHPPAYFYSTLEQRLKGRN